MQLFVLRPLSVLNHVVEDLLQLLNKYMLKKYKFTVLKSHAFVFQSSNKFAVNLNEVVLFYSLLYYLLSQGKAIKGVICKRLELLFQILEILLSNSVEDEVHLNAFFLDLS